MIFLTNFFNWITNFKGELAALSAAFLWAIASLVYSRLGRQIPPLELNLFKGIIAIAFLVLTLLLQGQLLPEINPTALTLLLLSGVLGIGLGDTAYFAAIQLPGCKAYLDIRNPSTPLNSRVSASLFTRTTDGCCLVRNFINHSGRRLGGDGTGA
ncbi:EamA family transporter [Trichocoleus sp. DQ-U1]